MKFSAYFAALVAALISLTATVADDYGRRVATVYPAAAGSPAVLRTAPTAQPPVVTPPSIQYVVKTYRMANGRTFRRLVRDLRTDVDDLKKTVNVHHSKMLWDHEKRLLDLEKSRVPAAKPDAAKAAVKPSSEPATEEAADEDEEAAAAPDAVKPKAKPDAAKAAAKPTGAAAPPEAAAKDLNHQTPLWFWRAIAIMVLVLFALTTLNAARQGSRFGLMIGMLGMLATISWIVRLLS